MKPLLSIKIKIAIFFFCLAVIIGNSYLTYDTFDFSHSIDSHSYIGIAQGDFNVTITHRYRIIVPFIAAAINKPVSLLFKKLWPDRDLGLNGLLMSFFVVNTLLCALTGYFIYLMCLDYGASYGASLIGLLAFLTSGWMSLTAGLPLTDSLYLLIIAMTLFGLKRQSGTILIICIFVGPLAKESFVFIAPLILFFGRKTLNLYYQIPLFILSGILVFGIRHLIDMQVSVSWEKSLENAMDHSENIIYTCKRLFSVRGLGEFLRVWGIFSFIPLIGLLGGSSARKLWMTKLDLVCPALFIVIMVHIFLSGDAGRMLFFASPMFALICAFVIDKHPYFQEFKKLTDFVPAKSN